MPLMPTLSIAIAVRSYHRPSVVSATISKRGPTSASMRTDLNTISLTACVAASLSYFYPTIASGTISSQNTSTWACREAVRGAAVTSARSALVVEGHGYTISSRVVGTSASLWTARRATAKPCDTTPTLADCATVLASVAWNRGTAAACHRSC